MQPIRPKKVFGFLFFQRFYRACKKSYEQEIKQKYDQLIIPYASQEFKDRKGRNPNYNAKTWNSEDKAQFIAQLGESEVGKKLMEQATNIIEEKNKISGGTSIMNDLHATNVDARAIYSFMTEMICKDLRDITIMSTESDYNKLVKKPDYQGDYLKQMFDWNLNQKTADNELEEIKKAMTIPEYNNDSWEDFESKLLVAKFNAKINQRAVRKKAVAETIQSFKKRGYRPEYEYVMQDGQMVLKQDDKIEDLETMFKYKIQCEDFWRKRDDPRCDKILRKMHPLIFLKERLPAYIKIQNNWIFQYLSEQEKKDYLQSRKPIYLTPIKANYTKYMDEIAEYSNNHKDEEILSLQTFACHGINHEGSQKCLLNYWNQSKTYYEIIEVEIKIRQQAVKLPKVYFLVCFACCREGKEILGDMYKEENQDQSYHDSARIANFTLLFGCDPAHGVAANTKMVEMMVDHLSGLFDPEDGHALIPECFGTIDAEEYDVALEQTSCNLGKSLRLVRQDNRISLKQLIVVVAEHPDFSKGINSKLTENQRHDNLGSDNELLPNDNENQLLINKNQQDSNAPSTKSKNQEKGKEKKYRFTEVKIGKTDVPIWTRTNDVIDFFVETLRFDREHEIIYFTEKEIKSLIELLDQSKIFKQYNIDIEKRIYDFARWQFSQEISNCSQLLTVFVNESRDESIKDFVINRNPEFAFTIVNNPNQSRKDEKRQAKFAGKNIKKYLQKVKERFNTLNQIKFSNFNQFFKSKRDYLEFCAREKMFKPGSGHFDLIFDLEEAKDQAIMSHFNFLEKLPLRKFKLSRHSLGLAVEKNQSPSDLWSLGKNDKEKDTVLIIELIDINNDLCHEEIVARLPLDKPSKKTLIVYKVHQHEDEFSIMKKQNNAKPEDLQDPAFKATKDKQSTKNEAKPELLQDSALLVEKDRQSTKKLGNDFQNQDNDIGDSCVVPDMCETDEVVRLQVLYHEKEKQEIFFAIILNTQHSLTICRVTYDGKPKIYISSKQIVREKKPRSDTLMKSQNTENTTSEFFETLKLPNKDGEMEEGTELQWHFQEEWDKYTNRKNFKRRQLMIATDTLSTKIEFGMRAKLVKLQTEQTFKLYVEEEHLNVFAMRNKNTQLENKKIGQAKAVPRNADPIEEEEQGDGQLYFYVLTNYTLISNTQSQLEVEVWKWTSDNTLEVKTGRRYLPDFVMDHKGKQPHWEALTVLKNMNEGPNKERIYRENKNQYHEYKVMKTFYEFPKQDNRDENIEEQKQEFWNKKPSCFRQSTDEQFRIIFRAGSRSNFVFDLKMWNGQLRLFSKQAINNKKAFGLQKMPFVRDVDIVGPVLINLLTKDYVSKWRHTTVIKDLKDKETLLRDLPVIVWAPKMENKKNSIRKFLFAKTQTAIWVVNTDNGREAKLVQQRAYTEHDCLENLFITYKYMDQKDIAPKKSKEQPFDRSENQLVVPDQNDDDFVSVDTKASSTRDKKSSAKAKMSKKKTKAEEPSPEPELERITLHYFEKFYDYRKKLKRCTYNTFDLTQDFLQMLARCDQIIPSDKTELIKDLKKIKELNLKDEKQKLAAQSVITALADKKKPQVLRQEQYMEKIAKENETKIQEMIKYFEEKANKTDPNQIRIDQLQQQIDDIMKGII